MSQEPSQVPASAGHIEVSLIIRVSAERQQRGPPHVHVIVEVHHFATSGGPLEAVGGGLADVVAAHVQAVVAGMATDEAGL
ncbi:hypothetical protein TRAPUB_4914 [Trametes pubescens]|uniref:Uncharacterized protein n=1 Tax=Trametes pubescens TaxID=154538 RepID=A0A1M2V9Q5_TRAPU|nr:hypothetical protein TRAPUB_4914 [Trametes pubescens]